MYDGMMTAREAGCGGRAVMAVWMCPVVYENISIISHISQRNNERTLSIGNFELARNCIVEGIF